MYIDKITTSLLLFIVIKVAQESPVADILLYRLSNSHP